MSSKENTNIIIETLKAQAEIFGDELYFSLNLKEVFNKKEDDFNTPSIITTSEKTESEELPSSFSFLNKKPNDDEDQNKVKFNDFQNFEFMNAASISELESKINTCKKCPLGNLRTKFVFGEGNPNADIMLIGEAPGAEEDKTGKPFVGRAGQLLTKILEAIKIKREEVFIANILKCRPPDNRTPNQDEISSCIPYLKKQIELIKPKVILCLGVTAANGLLNTKSSMVRLRGNVYEFHGVKLMVTYHPAALLRNPNWKKETWEDVQQFYKLYQEILNQEK
jgi:DNA polymerase